MEVHLGPLPDHSGWNYCVPTNTEQFMNTVLPILQRTYPKAKKNNLMRIAIVSGALAVAYTGDYENDEDYGAVCFSHLGGFGVDVIHSLTLKIGDKFYDAIDIGHEWAKIIFGPDVEEAVGEYVADRLLRYATKNWPVIEASGCPVNWEGVYDENDRVEFDWEDRHKTENGYANIEVTVEVDPAIFMAALPVIAGFDCTSEQEDELRQRLGLK